MAGTPMELAVWFESGIETVVGRSFRNLSSQAGDVVAMDREPEAVCIVQWEIPKGTIAEMLMMMKRITQKGESSSASYLFLETVKSFACQLLGF